MNDESRGTEPKDPRIQAALREFLDRVDRGEVVDREEFIVRHAPIADQLRSAITAEQKVRKLVEAETPPDYAHDSTKSFAAHGQETIAPQPIGNRALDAERGGTGPAGRFGRYRIIRALGRGGMGTVYLAVDTLIERQVALKTPHFTEDPTGKQMERFFREARSAGNLRHPNICPIYDFGQIDGKHFITMAYIDGRPLSALIQPDKPLPERQILIVIRKLALALQAAHDKGIVHRDLKPANIMVDTSGEPIIMDFGLARQASQGGDIRLTQTGNIIGTPAFMSPEQVEGDPKKIGPPTDQYSLGVILYELLTGQLPFQGSVMAVMGQILTKEPPRPSQLRPEMDQRIETVCLRMMAKMQLERFASLKAAADELATIRKSPAWQPAPKEKPGPHRAREIQEKYSGHGEGGTARIGVLNQFRRPLNDGGWIPWSALAFGLAVFALMAAVVVSYLGRTAVVTDIKDPGVEVAVQGTPQAITSPDKQSVTVVPGGAAPEQNASSPTAGGKTPLLSHTRTHDEMTTAADIAHEAPLRQTPPSLDKSQGPLPADAVSRSPGAASPLLSPEEGSRAGEERDDNALKLKLCWCPAGTTPGFWIGKYEVTQSEWAAMMGSIASHALDKGNGDRYPIYYVSRDDATEFCWKLTKLEQSAGRLPAHWAYQLPTEAQWEYACRAGMTTATAFGDKLDSTQANFNGDWPHNGAPKGPNLQRAVEVGSYRPNAWGIYDMHGNVGEFTATPGVIRGGSWYDSGRNCCSEISIPEPPNVRSEHVGFRVARVPSDDLNGASLKAIGPR